ncbi:mannose-1-phosphate guanylyltransferase [Pseudomonas hunanensis]|nr:mannose-1-phosphate guanylyltransferase [Pseudomonas hunanensis]
MSVLIPCIIAGGAGTRLWPVSREAMPKPFMRLPDGMSLLQKTFSRASSLPGVERVLTVTNREVVFRTQDEYRQVGAARVALDFILEPLGRNTAPAITAAALHCARLHGEDSLLLVLPADHLIQDQGAFEAAVGQALALAGQGWLTTFGLQPTRAETGFGYIEQGQPITDGGYQVARFVEKPDADTAQGYLDGGRHLWNAGMFCLRVGTVLQELQAHAPEVLRSVADCLEQSQVKEGTGGLQVELDPERFALVPDISIDYALMEPSAQVAVVPCDIGWSDIGCWEAVRELRPADGQGNHCNGETVLLDVRNCYIDSPRRLVGAVGLDNLIVIDTPDALLIADAARSQEVKVIAQQLKRQGHDAYRLHRTVTRPLGPVHGARGRATVQDQAHHGPPWRIAVAADAPSSQRALDRGQRHGLRDQRPGGVPARHQRVHLHQARAQPPPDQPWGHRPGDDRGAEWRIPGRRRHRTLY